MRRTLAISAIVLAGLSGTASMLHAQSMFGTGSRGSSRSSGGGLGGGSMGMGSSFGGGMGQSGLGMSGLGLSGLGSSGFGMSGFGQSGMGSGFGSQTRQSSNFIGVNSDLQSGGNFLGVAPASGGYGSTRGGYGGGSMYSVYGGGMGAGSMYGGQQRFGGQMGGGMYGRQMGGQMLGQRGGQMGGYAMNGRRTSAANQIRTTTTVGFEAPAASTQKISSSVAQRLTDMPAIHWQAPVQVEIRGRTAILRGVVATQHDRDLAERVVRLEATIDEVENQLVVAANSTKAATPTEQVATSASSAR